MYIHVLYNIILSFVQTSKEEVMELNAELDKLKLDMGNSHSTAGNSLFGEVSFLSFHTHTHTHTHTAYIIGG